MPQTPSTRWCPTPEQLMILEEMYKGGVRTPNASQIQHITAHLSFYGRIEGKNVFYWFQNHKARDRQKLRRRLSRHHHCIHGCHSHFNSLADASLFPTTQLYQYPHTTPISFVHQRDPQEKIEGMNLLCKLESSGNASPTNNIYGHDWNMMMMMDANAHQSLKPLKTLDLFPTKSTGLKDGCSTTSTY